MKFIKKWIGKIKPYALSEVKKIKYMVVSTLTFMFIFVFLIAPVEADRDTSLYILGFLISFIGIYLMRLLALFLKNWLGKQEKLMT